MVPRRLGQADELERRGAGAKRLLWIGKKRTLKTQPFLTRTRWLLLERPENLTPKQEIGLGELLLRSDLRSVRAYLLEEDLQRIWSYVSPYWAGVFLDRWCTRSCARGSNR